MDRATTQRIALVWVIIFSSFFVCVLLTVAVPVGAGMVIERARKPLRLVAQASQGTLVRDPGTPLSIEDNPTEMVAPVRLVTNNLSDAAFVQLYHPDMGDEFLGRVRLYGNSRLRIDKADYPRFARSDQEPRLLLALERGRLRLTVAPSGHDAPFGVRVETPHGTVWIDQEGEYSLETNDQLTQISVLAGEARLVRKEREMRLSADQRVLLDRDGTFSGPFTSERNLLENSDFSHDLARWIVTSWSVERDDQPAGETRVVDTGGEKALRFTRFGLGNAKTEVRQLLNQDVTDFSQLRLDITLRIWEQSLDVCGSVGSECPLTVRMEFDDETGRTVAWQQGFYATGEPSDSAPPFCTTCGLPLRLANHVKPAPVGELGVYESENWIELMQLDGFRPIRLRSVSLIAEGHSFEVDVVQIALIGQE
jgi:hypothetical protein